MEAPQIFIIVNDNEILYSCLKGVVRVEEKSLDLLFATYIWFTSCCKIPQQDTSCCKIPPKTLLYFSSFRYF